MRLFFVRGTVVTDIINKNYEDDKFYIKFRIADNKWEKPKNSTEGQQLSAYYSVIHFCNKKKCDEIMSFLKKGERVFIAGDMFPRNFINKDGKELISLEITASTVYPLSRHPKIDCEKDVLEYKNTNLVDDDVPF